MDRISGNALVMKEINIHLIYKALKAKGTATKQQIAKETGLSLVTVGTVLQHLAAQKKVLESDLSPSNGGRPAKLYRYNEDYAYALVVFPYEEHRKLLIRSTVVNMSGHCVYTADTNVAEIALKSFDAVIEPLYKMYPSINMIGFGHPGVLENGEVIVSDYEQLLGTSFAEYFNSHYRIPVIIENDVNAAVLGFSNRTKLSPDSTLVYLYFPDRHPPGAGILLNGKLHKGINGFAGEVSTIPLGVHWDEALYSSSDKLCDAVSKLILTICAILNPHMVILNGNCLSQSHIEDITRNCHNVLPGSIAPVIRLSDSFNEDYQTGLIAQLLEQLEPEIQITRK